MNKDKILIKANDGIMIKTALHLVSKFIENHDALCIVEGQHVFRKISRGLRFDNQDYVVYFDSTKGHDPIYSVCKQSKVTERSLNERIEGYTDIVEELKEVLDKFNNLK